MLLSGRSRLHKSELYEHFLYPSLFISWYLYCVIIQHVHFIYKTVLCYVKKKTKLVDGLLSEDIETKETHKS